MGHDHSHHSFGHHHHTPRTRTVLLVSLVVTLLFVALEAMAGWWSGSLALLSDAGHNFTDAFGLGLATVAITLETKPGDHIRTFGYQRTEVLAAFLNALMLVALSVFLIWEGVERMRSPEPVADQVMWIVAAVGLVVNSVIAFGLGGHRDLNMQAAFLHQLGDAVSCLAIIIGAVVIHYTGWVMVDPVLSILMSLVIIWTAWDIFRDSLNILLEGLPKGLILADVLGAIRAVPHVCEVHDLHIWNLGSDARALSCHVVIEDMSTLESEAVLAGMNRVLADRFEIHHTTIQFEHTRCAVADSCQGGSQISAGMAHDVQ
jgi:cobalt-zinc-cadmium efflux system protein